MRGWEWMGCGGWSGGANLARQEAEEGVAAPEVHWVMTLGRRPGAEALRRDAEVRREARRRGVVAQRRGMEARKKTRLRGVEARLRGVEARREARRRGERARADQPAGS